MRGIFLAFGLLYSVTALPLPAWATQQSSVAMAPPPIGGLSRARIFIIRHAEKDGTGIGLSPAGKICAQVYAAYFLALKVNGRPIQFNSLVAASDTRKSDRPKLTLMPLSRATGLPIMQPCSDKDVQCMVSWLRERPAGQTTLISWHHTQIGKLLTVLGADPRTMLPKGRWPTDFFDWIAVLRFDGAGRIEPGELALIHEPRTVDDAVWAAMDHPTIRPLSD